MTLIRPEARSAILRWREALVGGAVSLWGLWWMLHGHGLIFWIGGIVLLAGLGLLVTGIQRGRFRSAAGGPGVVQVDEGQIGYFGPFTGGAVALTEMHRLALDPLANPPSWRLSQHGQPDLLIPLNAEGADALFDIFSALPGIRTSHLIAQVQKVIAGDQAEPVVIWDRSRLRLH